MMDDEFALDEVKVIRDSLPGAVDHLGLQVRRHPGHLVHGLPAILGVRDAKRNAKFIRFYELIFEIVSLDEE